MSNHLLTLFLPVLLSTAACAAVPEPPEASATELVGAWTVESIEGRPAVEPAWIIFSGDGRLSGNASCNRILGTWLVEQGELFVAPLAATRMACPAAQMDQERRLLEVFPRARRASVVGGVLVLSTPEGVELLLASWREEGTDAGGGGATRP